MKGSVKRWLSRDPIEEAWFEFASKTAEANLTGDDIYIWDPPKNAEMRQGPNLYEYVQNDPENQFDSFGLEMVPKMGCKKPCSKSKCTIACGDAQAVATVVCSALAFISPPAAFSCLVASQVAGRICVHECQNCLLP